jgi:hypothetical protein
MEAAQLLPTLPALFLKTVKCAIRKGRRLQKSWTGAGRARLYDLIIVERPCGLASASERGGRSADIAGRRARVRADRQERAENRELPRLSVRCQRERAGAARNHPGPTAGRGVLTPVVVGRFREGGYNI